MSAKKGSAFERQICKDLSRWWTKGKRDDVFWRSSQSGGRATQRAKFGKKTFGSYGDIAAVDPIGQPLLKFVTIELKRGRSHGCLADLIDTPEKGSGRAFQDALQQAIDAALQAKSFSWALIFRRDRKDPVICLELTAAKRLNVSVCLNRAMFRTAHKGHTYIFVALKLADFFKVVPPEDIVRET